MGAFGSATLSDSDFQVSNKLESATLMKTIEVFYSVSEPSFNVSVDLTWTGIGEPTNVNGHFHNMSPGFISNGPFMGTFLEAVAMGTVSDGATNFTQEPSFLSANIRLVRDGFITVVKF